MGYDFVCCEQTFKVCLHCMTINDSEVASDRFLSNCIEGDKNQRNFSLSRSRSVSVNVPL